MVLLNTSFGAVIPKIPMMVAYDSGETNSETIPLCNDKRRLDNTLVNAHRMTASCGRLYHYSQPLGKHPAHPVIHP
ncbi:MAG: hypothetical protein NC548_25240 [Lachnospiraceae bacterium]|nr:hypothetical protein [Lachnospiraceae bacterium]